MQKVTCILTSCGRQDLLERTLDSFFLYNTYPIYEFIIYEDSGMEGINIPLKLKYPTIKWVEPKERTGQIVALDTLWSMVTTEYAFTMEDDWLTYRSRFIEESLAILEAYPKVLQVWLREKEDTNSHPIEWPLNLPFGLMKRNHNIWSGCCFNPSLKRKSDYNLIAPFARHTQFSRKAPWKAEAAIGQVYNRLGFQAAIISPGFIKHIGDNGRHVE